MSQTEKKKLGFRDKIKKMLESDSPREKKKSIIEETNVKFTLTGGSVHSELLVAEAIMDSKNDNNYGMPLPIICKWYNKSKTDEITEIEGITGAFYQPNADDINTYIIVEAKPILEESEYRGESLRKEIGPIIIDKLIQEEVQELLETGKFKIAAKLESIYNPSMTKEENERINEQHNFPRQCTLQIDTDKVQINVQDDERVNAICSLGQFYPSIKIIKRTNNVFELYFNQNQVYRLQAQSNSHRDVITVALRMFCGKKLVSSQNQADLLDIDDDNDNENEQEYNQSSQQQVLSKDQSKSEEQPEKQSNNEHQYDNNEKQSQEKHSNEKLSNDTQPNERQEKQTNGKQINTEVQNSGDNQIKTNGVSNQSEVRAVRKHQTQASTSESYEVFVKLNELTKKTVDLEQLRDELKVQLQALQEENRMKESKLEQVDQQMIELKEKLRVQLDVNLQYKQKHSQYMNEKLFLTQELQVIQQEIEGKNREVEEHKQQVNLLKKQLEIKKGVIDEEEVQSMHNKIQDLAARLNQQIDQNKNLDSLLSEQEAKFNDINLEKESLENEVMHFKKKCEYLLQEKQLIIASQKSLDSPNTNRVQNVSSHHSINFNKKEDDSNSDKADNDTQNNLSGHNHLSQSQNNTTQFSRHFTLSPFTLTKSQSTVTSQQQQNVPKQQSTSSNGGSQILGNGSSQILGNGGSQNLGNGMTINVKRPEQVQDIEILKNQLQQKIEENHNLTKKVLQLETTLETVTQAYTQDVKSINSPTKRKLKEGGNEQILQKLVNSLTEMITEKDLAIDNQKNINKELISKISQLSANSNNS